MTTVLIPTNFKDESFDSVTELVNAYPGMPLKVLFFHPLGLSTCITDLLMISRRSREECFITLDFIQKCVDFGKQFFPEVTITWACFYGNTDLAFKNFIEAKGAEFIAVPASYQFEALDKESLDPAFFLDKCGLPVISLSPEGLTFTRKPEVAY